MNSMKNFVFLTVLLVVAAATDDEAFRTCSKKLPETQEMFCQVLGMKDSYKKGKNIVDAPASVPVNRISWPYMQKHVQKREADLVEECCNQPCTVSQLMRYC